MDAWSIGVIVYAILANASPFEEGQSDCSVRTCAYSCTDERLPLDQRMRERVADYSLLDQLGISAMGELHHEAFTDVEGVL